LDRAQDGNKWQTNVQETKRKKYQTTKVINIVKYHKIQVRKYRKV
jgi:hypothetical protein